MATILITRPLEEAQRLADLLKAKGFYSLIQPALKVHFLKTLDSFSLQEAQSAQAFVFTSKNGIKALAQNFPVRSLKKAFTVGKETARLAKEMGFQEVYTAEKDIEALKELLIQALLPNAGKIWYITGSQRRGELEKVLLKRGYEVEMRIAYKTAPVLKMVKEVKSALEEQKIDFILFFSPQTAQNFVKLLKTEHLQERTGLITAFCLSPIVADSIKEVSWKKIITAALPCQESLLNAVFQE